MTVVPPFGLRRGPQAAKGVALPAVPLPGNPSLEQLRKQAKDLRDLARAGVPGALELVAAHHPGGGNPVGLAGAQLVVARHYGFTSWARLKRHLEIIEHYRRVPDKSSGPRRPGR
jgi:hypothetical protein